MSRSYVEKINDAIYEAINVGIKNLKLAGYHSTSSGISINSSDFWVEIEGDHVDEIDDFNTSNDITITLMKSDSMNTSIDCALTAIDEFIKLTNKVIPIKKLEQKNLMFRSIVKSIASKIGIGVDVKDGINENSIHINITTPTKYFTSVDSKLQLDDIGIRPAVSSSYNDCIKYSLELENDEYAKFRFIEWLSGLPMNNTNPIEGDEYNAFCDIVEDMLESKHCEVKCVDEVGDSGLYKVDFYCPFKIRNALMLSLLSLQNNPLYDVYASNTASDEYESPMYYISIHFGVRDVEASKRAVYDLIDSLPDVDVQEE